jgi:hypothetical protein
LRIHTPRIARAFPRPDGQRRARISAFRSTIIQVAKRPAEVHFPVSGLEAVLHRGADPALRLRVADAVFEQVGIATEVVRGRERDGRMASSPSAC